MDRRVKTRSDLPGGVPLYILVGMIGFLNVTINGDVTELLGPITINPFATHYYIT